MAVRAGINGFGRFSLHLLKFWLVRRERAKFEIAYINDDTLTLEQSVRIINDDPYVDYTSDFKVSGEAGALIVDSPGGERLSIPYSKTDKDQIPWLGEPEIVLECSGKHANAPACQIYLQGKTKLVAISATSWDADATLVYGFNHESFDPQKHRVISYGSCTVNGYVPLAHYIHEQFGIIDSDVHVVHNVVRHRLDEHRTLLRKNCTLEQSAPLLLPEIVDDKKNFAVIYTVVPWDGVSMIDYRFRVKRPPKDKAALLQNLKQAMTEGPLIGLYGLASTDEGPKAHQGTTYSAVFIESGIRLLNDTLHLQSYFDTENSVNRYFDLINHIA